MTAINALGLCESSYLLFGAMYANAAMRFYRRRFPAHTRLILAFCWPFYRPLDVLRSMFPPEPGLGPDPQPARRPDRWVVTISGPTRPDGDRYAFSEPGPAGREGCPGDTITYRRLP